MHQDDEYDGKCVFVNRMARWRVILGKMCIIVLQNIRAQVTTLLASKTKLFDGFFLVFISNGLLKIVLAIMQ